MAESGGPFHRFAQSNHIDAVRWLPSLSAFDRFIAAAVYDPDAAASAVEIHALDLAPTHPLLHLRSSWPSPSRISSLRVSQQLAAAATFAGSLHILSIDLVNCSIDSDLSIPADRSLHAGQVSGVDLQRDGRECVTVGEDGRVNLVTVGEGKLERARVHDSRGLVSYTAVRWGSPAEFATGGLGFGLQWWDRRKPGGLVAQLKGDWARGCVTGMVHSIDIQPSRKHICMLDIQICCS